MYHWIGNDVVLATNRDIYIADERTLSQQRILRRLMTPTGSYIWHPEYGAGLGLEIGNTLNEANLTGKILAQMYLEPSVSRTPEPQISFSDFTLNGFTTTIHYTLAQTQEQVVLSFSVG